MALDENKALIRRFFAEVLNTGNVDAVGAFLVPNTFFSGFMQKFVAEMASGFPVVQITIDELLGESDKVVVCSTLIGTNSGPVLGHPPTNKSVTITGIWVFTVRDDKIISMRFASDMAQKLWLDGPA